MRIFNKCTEMYEETIRELFKRGQTVFDETVQGKVVSETAFEQKEIINYSYMLTDFSDIDEMIVLAKKTCEKPHITSHIAEVWFDDMISNDSLKEEWWNETEYTKKYYKDFCDEGNGNAAYSYGERVIPNLKFVIERLKKNIYSRGAVLNLFNREDHSRIGRRIPCTLSYHFIARKTIDGDKLNLVLTQRSCDMLNFFPLDIYKAYLLLKHVAKEVNVKVGYIIHNTTSLHCYKKDIPSSYTW